MSGDLERDERIAAWLDGALQPDEAETFVREIEADPELAKRASNWKANDSLIAGAFAPVAAQPVDEAMLARLGLAEPAVPQAANDNPPWWRRHALPLGGAIAASLAAVLLLVPRGAEAPQDSLAIALEAAPSGMAMHLADGRILTPILTLRAADGRWCREYRLEATPGLACRSNKVWKIEAVGKDQSPATSDGIVLAGGESDPAIDAAHARLGTGDPVNRAAEAALLQSNWGGR